MTRNSWVLATLGLLLSPSAVFFRSQEKVPVKLPGAGCLGADGRLAAIARVAPAGAKSGGSDKSDKRESRASECADHSRREAS